MGNQHDSQSSSDDSIWNYTERKLQEPQQGKCVVLLGLTQVGKTTLCNKILNRGVGKIGKGLKSTTEICEWHSDEEGKFEVLDTPGFDDTRGDDERPDSGTTFSTSQYHDIKTKIESKLVHAIVVVVSADNLAAGLNQNLYALAIAALERLGDLSVRKMGIVVNKWKYTDDEKWRRENEESLTREMVQERLSEQLTELLQNSETARVLREQLFFLDVCFIDRHPPKYETQEDCRELLNECKLEYDRFIGWLNAFDKGHRYTLPQADGLKEGVKSRKQERKNRAKEVLARQKEVIADSIRRSEQSSLRASFCALISALAYLDETTIREICSANLGGELNFHHHSCAQSQGPSYIIYSKDHTTILAFRGTEVADVLENLSNINTQTVQAILCEAELQVHSGFYTTLSHQCWADTILDQVIDALGRSDSKRLVYAGHSRGGALAILCRAMHVGRGVLDRLEIIATYTFGAPQVFGTSNIPHKITHNSYNYVFGADIVPRLLLWGTTDQGTPSQSPLLAENVKAVILGMAGRKYDSALQIIEVLGNVANGVGIAGGVGFGGVGLIGCAVAASELAAGATAVAAGICVPVIGLAAIATCLVIGGVTAHNFTRRKKVVEDQVRKKYGYSLDKLIEIWMETNRAARYLQNTDEEGSALLYDVQDAYAVPGESAENILESHNIKTYILTLQRCEVCIAKGLELELPKVTK